MTVNFLPHVKARTERRNWTELINGRVQFSSVTSLCARF